MVSDKEILSPLPEEWSDEKLKAAAERLQAIVARHRAAREAKAQQDKSKAKKVAKKDLLDC